MLSNYRTLENGGNGWLRILRFSPEEEKIYITTYSPSLRRINDRPDQSFVINEYRQVFQ